MTRTGPSTLARWVTMRGPGESLEPCGSTNACEALSQNQGLLCFASSTFQLNLRHFHDCYQVI